MLGTSCEDKKEEISPNDISNIIAVPGTGQITLKWDLPEDSSSIFYVKISYYDHKNKKDKSILASNNGDSAVITGLLKRFGEYEFTLQTYSETLTANLNKHNISAICNPVPPSYTFGEDMTEIPLTEAMLSTNAQEPNEGPIANLIDGNAETFFHSKWSGGGMDLPHWIDITLESATEYGGISFKFQNRHNKDNDSPKTIEVYGSMNGADGSWELLETVTNTLFAKGEEFTSSRISLLTFEQNHGQRPKSFRFSVTETADTDKYFAMAGFWLYGYETYIVNPETDPL